MKRMKKVVLIFMLAIIILMGNMQVKASHSQTLEELIKQETSINPGKKIDAGDILAAYDELSEKYTNKELANIIDEHSDELSQYGVDKKTISTGTNVLRTVDTDQMKKILKENINLEDIKDKVDKGYSSKEIIQSIDTQLSTTDKLNMAMGLLLATSIFRNLLIIAIVLFVYGTIIRWILYQKAGKHGFAAIIPIYRQVTMFKICQMSPWWLLLLLVPIIGWLILGIIYIINRFRLSFAFGKGWLFGLGILLLEPIFTSIIAFSKAIEYEGIEE